MKIVTDTGMDISSQQREKISVELVPLYITLNDKTYRSGIDINHEQFYKLLNEAEGFPETAPPSIDDFIQVYRKLAREGEEIVSIHISSGLSETIKNARTAAEQVPEATVHFIDSLSGSVGQAWQVEAIATAIKNGKPPEKLTEIAHQVHMATDTAFTLANLNYLIHGGRINHLTGLIANALQIRPLLRVQKEQGIYEQAGRARTFRRSILKIGDVIAEKHPPGSELRIQIFHADSPDAVDTIRDRLDGMFKCHWLPSVQMAPVLAAHTGPGLVGASYGALSDYKKIPGFLD